MSSASHQSDFNLTTTIIGGVVATLVVTATLYVSGTDIVKSLGMMLLGSNATPAEIYAAGGVMHLGVGIAYGLLYTLLFAPVYDWNGVTKGLVFGVFVTALALSFMPVAASFLSSNALSSENPCFQTHNACNPCATSKNVCNPCNPCGVIMKNACHTANSCNPCGNNPCGSQKRNSCSMNLSSNPCGQHNIKMSKPHRHTSTTVNPCAGANPCGGGKTSDPYASLTSLINHLFFGLTLALFIRRPD
ncbi:MAG TPA: hypothetical protein ENK06_02765 [Gammaproteobacteria bacterium]|nr:hypothetical protein [Gammaproteobacteria bacterium]